MAHKIDWSLDDRKLRQTLLTLSTSKLMRIATTKSVNVNAGYTKSDIIDAILNKIATNKSKHSKHSKFNASTTNNNNSNRNTHQPSAEVLEKVRRLKEKIAKLQLQKGWRLRRTRDRYMRVKFHSIRSDHNLNNFNVVKILNTGSIGTISLVVGNYLYNSNKYAIKTLCKKHIITKNRIQFNSSVITENKNEFLSGLNFIFQDKENIYFVMDYYINGNLYDLLQQNNIFNEEQTKFYIAELCVAINEIHCLGFIIKYLSFGNILIGNNGHIK
eukprot:289027_1